MTTIGTIINNNNITMIIIIKKLLLLYKNVKVIIEINNTDNKIL